MTKQRTTVTTTEAEIRALVDQRLTITEVAKRLNVSLHKLRAACSLLGIRSKRSIDSDTLQEWVGRIESGETAAEIAYGFGVTRQHVYCVLKKAGLPTTTRDAIRARREAEFPGVDIDAVHRTCKLFIKQGTGDEA